MSSLRKVPHEIEIQEKKYWRSLDQLAETEEFKSYLHREFPENASELAHPVSRRTFLSLMSASIALAGLAGCRRPVEKIIPYVVQPEEIVPGIALRYATTMPFGTHAYGVIVESHEGRPTKVEGSPNHPASLGSTNLYAQASILDLYDPDRSQMPWRKGVDSSWADFVAFWQEKHPEFVQKQGEGLAVLSPSFSSPTLARLKTEYEKTFPKAKWATYDPVSEATVFEGIKLATGQPLQPVYHVVKAKRILALDADFTLAEYESVVNARGFADGRRVTNEQHEMNRLYVVESGFSITGGMADHRLRLNSSQIGNFVLALIGELQQLNVAGLPAVNIPTNNFNHQWLTALAKDLAAHPGESLIIAGRQQPPIVHALAYALNDALGNVNQTVEYFELKDKIYPDPAQFTAFVESMRNETVDTLIMLGGNPIFTAPADLKFDAALKKVKHPIHLSDRVDETSQKAEWHLHATHFLEAWGDARAADGTLSVIQPLIAPLFGAHSEVELLSLILTATDKPGYDVVRETWKQYIPGLDFTVDPAVITPQTKKPAQKSWHQVLHDGVLADSRLAPTPTNVNLSAISAYFADNPPSQTSWSASHLEIVFRPDPGVFDGRFANNGWLQEMPDHLTKTAWDNMALLSPKTAQALGVTSRDLVDLSYQNKSVEIPVWIVPGLADNTVIVSLGYGRTAAGRVGNSVGVNVYPLRTSTAPDFDLGATLSPLGRTYEIACIQDHGSMEGRPIVREAPLEEYQKHPEFARHMVHYPDVDALWDTPDYSQGYQWGMTIDLNACTGCNVCMIACQSENNIPIVGKKEMANGREMHWIRLDRYFTGDMDDPELVYMPVGCQHCQLAPCEQVCPVIATVHDKEGLNVMVYNRCVGTRYCANNCPYKVRRFNFLEYNPGSSGFLEKKTEGAEILKMAKNPDVTVRMRGVMEKCTYCTQRISEARIKAKNEDRDIVDGEVVTACQQACPTNAIVFGNLNDPNSQIAKMKENHRRYELLAEINTQPRTSFLAKLRNPNPELV